MYGVNVLGKTFGEKLSVTDEVQQLTPDEVAALAEAGETVIFDARTSSEYAKGHIPGAYNIPGASSSPRSSTPASTGLTAPRPSSSIAQAGREASSGPICCGRRLRQRVRAPQRDDGMGHVGP